MAKVQEGLTEEGPTKRKTKPREGKLVSFWVSDDVYKDIKAQAALEQLNVSDYARARVHGHGVRDRSAMAAIAGLHVAGRALIEAARSIAPREDHEGMAANALIGDIRRLTAVLTERLG